MEGRKLWVVALLSCLFLAGASIAVFRTASANKAVGSATSAPARQEVQVAKTLHVSGNYPQLKYRDSADLPENPDAAAAATTARPVSLLKADVNGDGSLDMLALYATPGGSEVRVRLNTPDQVLLNPVTIPVNAVNPSAFVAGDFNVDGNQDIAVASRDGSITLLYGDGRGGFNAGPKIFTGGSISAMAAIDVDRDGLADLLVLDQASGALRIYINQGDLSQAKPESIDLSALGNLEAIQAADFNVDFFNDIAVAGDKGVAVLFGDGKGHFSKPHKIGSVGPVAGMVLADFSGDHIPDIAVAGVDNVTVFNSHRSGRFSAGKSYNAGSGITAIAAGAFDADGFTDIAVADGSDQVSVLLNKQGHGFSDPMPMSVDDGAVALLTGFDRRVGIDSIAIQRKTSGITVAAASGGTITVTTQVDENDCPSCDVAGIEAFLTVPSGHPGGNTGLALREAITAINNDSVLHGSSNWTISFAGIGQAASAAHSAQGPFHCQHLNQGTSWLCIIGADALGNPNGLGDLPPVDSPGTTIDGSLVDHTANGVNNPDGPQTIIRGNNTTRLLVLTSNATNSTVKNLNLVNSLGDALVVQGSGNTITGNVIGLDCDSSSTQGPLNDGNGGAGIN
ncbi:MAG TPA: VCBS repeat-containing protein, partial [Blastocatellia bacterium]|nr:VCBS repeat-containing protein [Blastocatellia bacterium]